jgi:hypothetical protein
MITEVFDPEGRPFTWSFSAMSDYDTCPFQYAAKRFYRSIKFEETEATLWGSRVHKAKELRLSEGTPLPKEMDHWEKYCRVLETKGAAPSELYVEKQIALDVSLKPVDWFAPTAWARGVVDVLIIDGDTAYIYDWKTGKVKDNLLQLQLFAWFVNHAFPGIVNYVCRFIWLKFDKITGEDFTYNDIPAITKIIDAKTQRMMEAWKLGLFQPSPSGLCRGWCPVEECIHWKGSRR